MKIKTAHSLIDKGKTYRNISYIFYALGGSAIVGGGILFYLDIKSKKQQKGSPVLIIPSPSGFLIKGGF